jgi:thiol-disulfide isomerase/thioredoxin
MNRKILAKGLMRRLTLLFLVLALSLTHPSANVAEAGIDGWKRHPFSLRDTNGALVTDSQLKGRRVFIDVWAIWCAPCVKALPKVQALQSEFQGRSAGVVLSVHYGTNYGRFGTVTDFLEQNRYKLSVIFDPGGVITKRFNRVPNITSLPKYILLDEDGRVVRQFSSLNSYEIKQIRQYLSASDIPSSAI